MEQESGGRVGGRPGSARGREPGRAFDTRALGRILVGLQHHEVGAQVDADKREAVQHRAG